MRPLQQVFRVPPHLSAITCSHVTKFCKELQESIAEQVVIDASNLDLADPFGLCLTAATLQGLKKTGCDVVVHDLPESQMRYLERMDFFSNAGIEIQGLRKRRVGTHRAPDLMELRQLSVARDIDRISRSLAETTVGGIPGLQENQLPDEMTGYTEMDRLLKPLQYVFTELLENSLTHGKKHQRKSANAWIACQYDPSRDRIKLAIIDNGCGLKRSLSGHPAMTEDSDLGAIVAAVKPRVSSNRELGIRIVGHESINQGIGLTICRDIALQSGGIFHMLSGISHAMFQRGGSHRARDVYPWFGTAVAVELDRSALRSLRLDLLIRVYQQESGVPSLRFT